MNAAAENPALAEAIILEWSYKPAAMQKMMRAVCRSALAKGTAGFSANDLPEELDHGGRGIAGSIFHRLAADEVLSPVGTFDASRTFQQSTVRNAGGNLVRVWRLNNAALARALLKVHGQPVPEMKQTELLPS